MKFLKRIICIVLSLVFMMQLLAGCSTSPKTDETIYLTKGEFFAYFVYENNMSSKKFTADDIKNSKDGSVEAEIIAEWGYLTNDQATKDIKKHVTKEIVVMVCANATFDLKQGNTKDIKDADMLQNPQLIADAYASGFFELENGYFDGEEKMSFADCERVWNNAKKHTTGVEYSSDSVSIEYAEGVKVQDSSNYSENDIIIDFEWDEETSDTPNQEQPGVVTQSADMNKPKITLLGTASSSLVPTQSDAKVVPVDNRFNGISQYGYVPIKGFTGRIRQAVFEQTLGNPEVGDTVIMSRYDMPLSTVRPMGAGTEIIGILLSKRLIGNQYECIFEYPEFERAVTAEKMSPANVGAIKNFKLEETEYAGWKLSFETTSNGVKINAKKDFTVYETGRKQDWQNSKQTMSASASFEISDFEVKVKNLEAFAGIGEAGHITIQYDTGMEFSLGQSLRYTPDSNRNGKFPSNWNNSRWTDADSKGATEIKIARFSNSIGCVGIDIYVYLLISVDGKISFRTSIDDGGIQITANNGNISTTKLGTKKTEAEVNVNLHGRLGIDASLRLFCFINVMEYDVGADLDINAAVNLYYEEQLSKAGVYADAEGLSEYAADDSKFNYCIGVWAEFGISGYMKDSGVKMILDLFDAGNALNFELPIWSGGFHYEDGAFVDKCSREEDKSDELKESENDEVELETYKVNLVNGTCTIVSILAVPAETVEYMNSSFAILPYSLNKDVCTVKYDKLSKRLIIESVGEGSTEIVIVARQGALWWKDACEQKISVTVTASSSNAKGVSYSIPKSDPDYYFV